MRVCNCLIFLFPKESSKIGSMFTHGKKLFHSISKIPLGLYRIWQQIRPQFQSHSGKTWICSVFLILQLHRITGKPGSKPWNSQMGFRGIFKTPKNSVDSWPNFWDEILQIIFYFLKEKKIDKLNLIWAYRERATLYVYNQIPVHFRHLGLSLLNQNSGTWFFLLCLFCKCC